MIRRRLIAAVAIGLTMVTAAAARSPDSVFLEDLTTTELRAILDSRHPVGIIFNSGFEETGPHIALGKHIFRARPAAERIARGFGNALVAPIIPFAPNPPYFASFAGTISLDPATFIAVNEQAARSLITGGFTRIAFVAEHGGGLTELADLAKRLDAEFAPKGVHVVYVSDYYRKARTQIEDEIRKSGRVGAGGHGGLWDTAETLAAKPDAVRTKLLPPGPYPEAAQGVDAIGVSGDPTGATAALGRHFRDIRVSLAIEELRRDFPDATPPKQISPAAGSPPAPRSSDSPASPPPAP